MHRLVRTSVILTDGWMAADYHITNIAHWLRYGQTCLWTHVRRTMFNTPFYKHVCLGFRSDPNKRFPQQKQILILLCCCCCCFSLFSFCLLFLISMPVQHPLLLGIDSPNWAPFVFNYLPLCRSSWVHYTHCCCPGLLVPCQLLARLLWWVLCTISWCQVVGTTGLFQRIPRKIVLVGGLVVGCFGVCLDACLAEHWWEGGISSAMAWSSEDQRPGHDSHC